MKQRIKELRKQLNLTQQEFADRIGIARGNIATYETRDGSPGDAVVALICREFNVNENWLRTGEGEMFRPTRRNDEITAFFGDILSSDSDFKHRFISVLARMTPNEWALLEAKIKELAGKTEKGGQ